MNELSRDALVEKADAIQSKADFDAFTQLLLQDYRCHPDDWGNNTLELFLEALAGFVEGMGGYYSNVGERIDMERPGWRVFADILLAARVYE